MKIISNANETVLAMLQQFSIKENCTRWSQFCVHDRVADGILIFNLLTRELILLNEEEYGQFLSLEYLKRHFFVVPGNTNEKERADQRGTCKTVVLFFEEKLWIICCGQGKYYAIY